LVRFVRGNTELDAIVIRNVEVESEPGIPQRYVIAGSARDGSKVELALELQVRPTERLRFDTQDATWRRADASRAAE
jgi:hypothetical protein